MRTARDMSYRDFGDSPKSAGSVEIFAPPAQISKVFDFQSYFDSTLLEKALLKQSPNQLLVESTVQEQQLSGYAIGLHPSSQTPVAIEFKVAGQSGSSGVMVLTPGQIVRPTGQRAGEKQGGFAGFRWGLPYGWLGGGMATLFVFQTPDANVDWRGNSEVIFHRARYAIKQPADITVGALNNAPKNWPLRFPWTQALRGANALPQQGQPSVSIADPTRVTFVLRGLTTLPAADNRLRLAFQATNDFGLDSAGAPVLTSPIYDEIVFPAFNDLGTSGNMSTQDPAVLYTGFLARVAADDGGLLVIDNSGSATFNGAFLDVCRYGRL